MPHRITRAALSAALVAGSTVFALSAPGPASAVDLKAALPITSFGDILVDGANKRIYITDPAAGKVIITGYAGQVLSTATGLTGVSGLLLAKDGDVYAAVPGLKAITAFNEVGTRIATYEASTDVRPVTLAEAGGRLWFGEADGGLGRLQRGGDDEPDLIPDVTTTTFDEAPALSSAGTLVAAVDPSVTTADVTVFDASTTTPSAVVAKSLGRTRDLVFNADGSRLLVAGPQSLARAVKPADLTTVQSYSAGADGNAVAVKPDGTLAVGIGGTAGKAVSVFAPGSATPTKQFTVQGGGTLQPGGLSWEPGGPRLFGVSGSGSSYTLQIFGDPSKLATSVQLTVPAKVELGRTATITGVFGAPVPAGLPVVITRKDSAGSRRVGPQTVPANGRFSISDKPTRSGTVSYTVALAGNADYSPANATKSFQVGTIKATTLTLDRNGSTFAAGSTVTFTAKLGATSSNRSVEIWADPYGSDQPNRLVRKATANSKGVVTAAFKLTRTTTMSAIFRGDNFTSARTARSTVATKVSVSVALDRHYGTGKLGSVSYHFLRSTVDPRFITSMSPYPGRSALLEIQYHDGKQWRPWKSAWSKLTDGKAYNGLTGTHTVGLKYRVRASYVYGKSGDTVNTTTYGAYKYFTFTR
ncbi:hypothetical protein [Paractinoplanes hotanensis]|uniref:Ig-like domain repeat protein n=1 Tax=Paractinoplanes hotanensis TaxID=2906497 RepID=A0ABT0Y7G8_9ACTN|nr:hypothetical protein [Actinoplanes hotanensis]MCM4081987.1 hypothetical protein [Actinoplanes hotanensis]